MRSRVGRVVMAMLLCASVTTLAASSIAFAQTRGNSGLPAGSGNPMADLQTQIAKLDQQMTLVQQQMAAVQQQIASLPALADKVAKLQAQMDMLLSLQTQVDNLAKTVATHASSLAKLGQDLSAVQGQMKMLGDMQTKLDLMVSGLSTRVSDLESRVGGVDTRVGALETRVGGVDSRVGALDTRVSDLQKQLNDLAAMKTDVNTLRSQVSALSSLQSDVKTLSSRVNDLASHTSGGALSVYDKNGVRIGDVVGIDQEGIPYLGLKVGDSTVVLQVYPAQIVGLLLWFDGVNCTGNTYVADTMLNTPSVFRFGAVLEPHGVVYAPPVPTPALVPVRLQSFKETNGLCTPFPMRTTALPVGPVLDLDSVYARGYSVR